jgi:hypothetical protein
MKKKLAPIAVVTMNGDITENHLDEDSSNEHINEIDNNNDAGLEPRDMRRKQRVEKKLQEMEQWEQEVVEKRERSESDIKEYEMLEFAERYYNVHLKDPGGTVMKTLTRRRKSLGVCTEILIFF